MLCYSTNFTNVKMKIDIFPAGSVENMYDYCQQIYCAKKKKAPTWQTGTFHVELAQLMAEAIWGKASCCPTVAH